MACRGWKGLEEGQEERKGERREESRNNGGERERRRHVESERREERGRGEIEKEIKSDKDYYILGSCFPEPHS